MDGCDSGKRCQIPDGCDKEAGLAVDTLDVIFEASLRLVHFILPRRYESDCSAELDTDASKARAPPPSRAGYEMRAALTLFCRNEHPLAQQVSPIFFENPNFMNNAAYSKEVSTNYSALV